MGTGAITQYIDLAQVVLYLFWAFFAALVLYIRREDKREGYPLESDRSAYVKVQGFPAMPEPKTFHLRDGTVRTAPRTEPPQGPIAAEPSAPWPGAPLEPTGNPMVDGVGPASYGNRSDVPDHTLEGHNRIVPLRVCPKHVLDPKDATPLGMTVYGADRKAAGTVVDAWVDLTEPHVRYLELELTKDAGGRHILLPVYFARIRRSAGRVEVASILAHQFADVPGLKQPDQVTLLEEDRICAYYGGGRLYAVPERQEPFV